nr:uncharacterized protein LOC111417746 [Onthophagus taurus]
MEKNRNLFENCEKITNCLDQLHRQRDELNVLIKKQEEEKKNLCLEIEKSKYKLHLITKSLEQKFETKLRYDTAINQAEEVYRNLVVSSNNLVGHISQEVDKLTFSNDKKIETDPSGT